MTPAAAVDPLATPKLLAIAGDWHANTEYAVRSIAEARRRGAETIVHVGDFGYLFASEFLEALDAALGPVPLLFVEGNHEDFDLLESIALDERGLRHLSARVWHLPRGFRWAWAGRTWLACGGATSVDKQAREAGVSWWPQEAVTDADVARIAAEGAVDVLVSHDSPAGADTPCDWEGRFPAEELALAAGHRERMRRLVDAVQPKRIFHGHYHTRYETQFAGAHITGLDRDGAPLEQNLLVIDPARVT